MKIRPVNPDDSDEVRAFYALYRAAELSENPERPTWPKAQMLSAIFDPTEDQAVEVFAGFEETDGEQMVGVGWVFFPLLDNKEKAYAEVFVAPDRRSKGVGAALVADLLARVEAAGRSLVLGQAIYSFERREDHPYRRFAERHGFTVASTEICRRLDLPLPESQLQAWIDEAAPHHADYEIRTFVNEIPDDLLDSVCFVLNQLILDAPTGDIEFEAEALTPEVVRQRERKREKTGLQTYTTVAVDRTGEAVAVTNIGLAADDPERAQQWATVVLREHRGHRLGLALKAHNLLAIQRDHPERTSVHTSNEETNGPMVDINERMGFRKVELLVEFQRRLDG